MKKLFISCPTKYRTKKNILITLEKMRQEAEIFFGEKLEILLSDKIDTDKEMLILSNSIKTMSKADFFIGIDWTDIYNNCNYKVRLNLKKYFRLCDIEKQIAKCYGIKTLEINTYDIMPDILVLPGRLHPQFLDNIV